MDKQSFGALVLQNEQQLYRVAKSLLKNDEDCADAAQEAVAKAYANLHTLREDRYAKTWPVRILINTCYRILKETSRNLPLDEKANTVDGMLQGSSKIETRQQYSELYEALLELPRDLRMVLVLYYLEGYSIKEIAQILQLPSGTVKSRMSRGREQLRKLLAET